MKAKIIIVLVCLMALLGGCIAAEYNPATHLVKYNRIGNMEASGIVVNIDPNSGMHVEVASEKNTGLEAVVEAFKAGLAAGLAAK